jgi:hypothetical protein
MPKNSPDYVWEKMYLAITSMCGKAPLEQRISNATMPALAGLNDDDLEGKAGEDLKYVLRWTKDNVLSGKLGKIPDDAEHSMLVEKMLSVLLATHDPS